MQESNFLYYKQMKPFIYNLRAYIYKLHYVDVRNISFKEHFLEDGHNRWPKHVGDYTVSNKINLHISIYTCW